MRSGLPIVRAPATAPSAATCGTVHPDLRNIIGIVRTTVPDGTGKWLERATGKSQRATEYWLQGTYQPKGRDTLAIARALRAELEARLAAIKQYEFDLR